MRPFARFMDVIRRLGSPRRKPQPTRHADEDEDEQLTFMLDSMVRSKWQDVEYYGPGAEEAEARRARRLGISLPEAQPEAKAESPRQRLRRLRKEIKALEKAAKKNATK